MKTCCADYDNRSWDCGCIAGHSCNITITKCRACGKIYTSKEYWNEMKKFKKEMEKQIGS